MIMDLHLPYHLPQPENSFRVFVKTDAGIGAPLHFHPEYEINLVIKSNGIRHVGNNIDHFEEGDLILLAPNIPHCWKRSMETKRPYSSLVIQWKDDLLGKAWRFTPEFEDIRRLLELSGRGIKFDKYIGNEIRDKQSDLLMRPPFEKLITFLQLLNDLARTNEFKILSDQELSLNNQLHSSRMDTVYQFIRDRYAEKITLAKVAALVNMSEGAFSRFFSQATKKPFFSFLNEYRITMACKLLMETDMRANEIGYACGYECPQFFYRQFTKYAKCAPQAYRKKFYAS